LAQPVGAIVGRQLAALQSRALQTVVFISDQPHAELYTSGLHAAGFLIWPVRSIQMCIEGLRRLSPDAVIVHLAHDDQRDWDECRMLVDAASPAPVMILTTRLRPDQRNVRTAFEIGCAAFVAEPCLPAELAQVAQRTIAGERRVEWPFARTQHPPG